MCLETKINLTWLFPLIWLFVVNWYRIVGHLYTLVWNGVKLIQRLDFLDSLTDFASQFPLTVSRRWKTVLYLRLQVTKAMCRSTQPKQFYLYGFKKDNSSQNLYKGNVVCQHIQRITDKGFTIIGGPKGGGGTPSTWWMM